MEWFLFVESFVRGDIIIIIIIITIFRSFNIASRNATGLRDDTA